MTPISANAALLRRVLLLLAGGLGFCAGCQLPAPCRLGVWVAPQSTPFNRAALNHVLQQEALPAKTKITLSAARNETVAFRVVMHSGPQALKHARLELTPLTCGADGSEPIVLDVYRMHPVRIESWPGWHLRSRLPSARDETPLDVLVPLEAERGGWPDSLEPKTWYYFWVDVAVPRNTAPGTYAGGAMITASSSAPATVQIELTVQPLTLPAVNPVPLLVEVRGEALARYHPALDSSDPEARGALLIDTCRTLRAHRIEPLLPALAPITKIKPTGGVALDWSAYDAFMEPHVSGQLYEDGVETPAVILPLQSMFAACTRGGKFPAPGYERLVEDYVQQCVTHFAQRGWLDRAFVELPPLEVGTPGAAERVLSRVGAIHDADERTPIFVPWFPQDMQAYGWSGYCPAPPLPPEASWITPGQFFDRRALAAERQAGRRTWLRVDRPPFSGSVAVHASPADTRVLAWQAQALRAQAVHLGCANPWPEPAGLDTPDAIIQADPNSLLYPGTPFGLSSPVPSVRLKYLRLAAQDGAYLGLLRHYGLEHISTTLTRSLAPYAGTEAYRTHFADGRPACWTGVPALWDLACQIMREVLLAAATAPEGVNPAEDFARQTAWRRLMLATRQLHLTVDGVRVRLTGIRSARAAEIEYTFTLANRTRIPAGGTLALADLPAGWEASQPQRQVDSVAPNGARRVMLSATTSTLRCGPGGHVWLPVVWQTEDGRTTEARACLSYAAAVPTEHPPKVDGNLSDWPAGAVNLAGNFTLIAPDDSGNQQADGRRPHQPTSALMLRDEHHLYVAVHCAESERSAPAAESHNVIRYDDLIPRDEDLIEVLLDPLNAGTRSPSDLHRIVVKRAGFVLASKGIRTEPPCGSHELWAADIAVATSVGPGGWSVELRIPLAALGPEAAPPAIWGFNLTRYDATYQEFSTWSGARCNAYDPLALGNLYLPESEPARVAPPPQHPGAESTETPPRPDRPVRNHTLGR